LAAISCLFVVAGCAVISAPADPPSAIALVPHVPPFGRYTYDVAQVFPHDVNAFTQGLAWADGLLYEGTGLEGRSSLRKVLLESGEVLASVALPDSWFGEGITICRDRVVQLTWQAGVGLVYDRHDLKLLGEFSYDTEGWGITYDGLRLIMSDGTDTVYFLNPETYIVEGSVHVRDGAAPVVGINELEFVDGLVYANVWPTDTIVMIDPADGSVRGHLDLSGLLASRRPSGPADVLNGIAWDARNERLFVTGKWWPLLFEIRLLQS